MDIFVIDITTMENFVEFPYKYFGCLYLSQKRKAVCIYYTNSHVFFFVLFMLCLTENKETNKETNTRRVEPFAFSRIAKGKSRKMTSSSVFKCCKASKKNLQVTDNLTIEAASKNERTTEISSSEIWSIAERKARVFVCFVSNNTTLGSPFMNSFCKGVCFSPRKTLKKKRERIKRKEEETHKTP